MVAGLVLLAYIAINTLIQSGLTGASWQAINGYHELIFAPLLMAAFSVVRFQRLFMWSLTIGCLLYAAIHWLALYMPELSAGLQSKRISAGFTLAVTAFVLALQSRSMASMEQRLARAIAAILAATVMFAINGRTGQVVLVVLLAMFCWQTCPPRWRLVTAVAAPLALVFATVNFASQGVKQRFDESFSGGSQGSSTTVRIEILKGSLVLAQGSFPWGVGFARYGEAHAKAGLAKNEGIHNPHNEFLMQLISGGVASLLLFLTWLYLLAKSSSWGEGDRVVVGVVLAFAIGCLFNSLLMDFVEGHVFITLIAWLYASRDLRSGQEAGHRI